jgi:hypothetical protein
MPVGGLRKRRRDRNLAAGRHQKLKGRIQANYESRRRLTVASRKMTRRARVAWLRKNVRKIRTHGNCGPWSKLATAGMRMTHSAKVAQHREDGHQRQVEDIARRTQKGRTEGIDV